MDLLVESAGKIDAYEIKWSKNPDKGLTSSLQMLNQEYPLHKMAILAPIDTAIPITPQIAALPWHTAFQR